MHILIGIAAGAAARILPISMLSAYLLEVFLFRTVPLMQQSACIGNPLSSGQLLSPHLWPSLQSLSVSQTPSISPQRLSLEQQLNPVLSVHISQGLTVKKKRFTVQLRRPIQNGGKIIL